MTTRAASGTGPGPVVGPAIRDLLEHPIPLIVANAVWGVLVFVAWTAWLVSPGAGFAATILLAWPAAAVAGVAGRIVRGGPVGIRDALAWPVRRAAIPVLAIVAILVAVVAIVDIGVALERSDLLGAAFATLAGWGLLALGVLACAVWPLLGDPMRSATGTRALLRLAVTVVFLHTARVALAALGCAVVLLVSTILVAPLLTVSLGLVALLLCRVVLPLADAYDPLPGTAGA